MNSQKFLSLLTLMGAVFLVGLIVVGFISYQNRGEVIVEKTFVPDKIARHFSRVISKNREESLPEVHFTGPEGQNLSFSDFKGEYVLVNFWATWCPPCVIELPSLDKLEAKLSGKGIKIMSISLDFNKTHEEVKKFLYNRDIRDFAAYMDVDGDIQANISIKGIPTSYLLDKNGNILHIFEGDAPWNAPEFVQFFTELLNHQK